MSVTTFKVHTNSTFKVMFSQQKKPPFGLPAYKHDTRQKVASLYYLMKKTRKHKTFVRPGFPRESKNVLTY